MPFLRPALLLLLVHLAACTTLSKQSSAALPDLPDITSLQCCWSATEVVSVSGANESRKILAVVERQDSGLAFVLLDPLSNPLLRLHQGDEELVVSGVAAEQAAIPVEALLWGVYLHQAPSLLLEAPWSVNSDAGDRVLRRGGRDVLRLRYLSEQKRELVFYRLGISVLVETVEKISL